MVIRILDSIPGGGATVREWEAPSTTITLRELLSDRVRGEVATFNRDLPEIYQGLVAPEESERLLNGYTVKHRRPLDPDHEIARAVRAFESNAFLVFSKGRQIDSLDEELDLSASAEVEFIRLLPLAGG